MRPASRLLLPLLLLASCQSRLCRDPDVWQPTEYTAPRTSQAPVIDGDLSDPAWAAAPWTEAWRRSNVNGPARQQTRAKLLWDDQFLYVAFEVEDDEILTPYERDDDPLYESEVVEIFLDANNDGRSYNEIELSPADKLFDASFVGRRQGMNLRWQSGVRHAVRLQGTLNRPEDRDQGWTAEMAIPFASLSAVPHLPPQPGERWTFNLYRLDHGRAGIEGQAFSPVLVPDFHHLPHFATLVFAGPGGK